MNRNYSNVDKRIWTQTNTFMRINHAYDKNNAEYVNPGFLPQQMWCYCKLRKCVGEQQMYKCANLQSLVTKQPILSQNETRLKRKRPTFLIALGLFEVQKGQYKKALFSKFVFGDNYRSSCRRRSLENVFLEIPQNSQENTCSSVSF